MRETIPRERRRCPTRPAPLAVRKAITLGADFRSLRRQHRGRFSSTLARFRRPRGLPSRDGRGPSGLRRVARGAADREVHVVVFLDHFDGSATLRATSLDTCVESCLSTEAAASTKVDRVRSAICIAVIEVVRALDATHIAVALIRAPTGSATESRNGAQEHVEMKCTVLLQAEHPRKLRRRPGLHLDRREDLGQRSTPSTSLRVERVVHPHLRDRERHRRE